MKVFIRPLTLDDAKTSWKWRNDPFVWKYTGKRPNRLITIEIEQEWLKSALQKENESRFAICIGKEMEYIGNIQLTDITKVDAQFHVFIGEKQYHNKGIGSCAAKLIIEYAFVNLNLKVLYLFVNSNNISAIRSYKKCGFKTIDIQNEIIKMTIENA
jgi:diamine N-acetyltransferase